MNRNPPGFGEGGRPIQLEFKCRCNAAKVCKSGRGRPPRHQAATRFSRITFHISGAAATSLTSVLSSIIPAVFSRSLWQVTHLSRSASGAPWLLPARAVCAAALDDLRMRAA
jgi:hypothetical protein